MYAIQLLDGPLKFIPSQCRSEENSDKGAGSREAISRGHSKQAVGGGGGRW